MSLRRYSQAVDGTIPVQALLYEDEDFLASQEGVGIYDGTQKSAPHQAGTVHVTTHRLFYIDTPHPETRSFAIDLAHISRTEYYAGLFTSSSKVTLYFNAPPARSSSDSSDPSEHARAASAAPIDTWECGVCGNRNPSGLNAAASQTCTLCGVPRAAVKPSITVPASATSPAPLPHLSSSLPAPSPLPTLTVSSSSPAPASPPQDAGPETACPACTFLNHPSLPACEICGSPLPQKAALHPPAQSAPASRAATPLGGDSDDDAPERRMIRVSFRKGGDKAFYAVLRRSLLGKAWETKARSAAAAHLPAGTPSARTGVSGINGILRTVETSAASAQGDLEDALQDLEALMVKWRAMVRLAEDLNARLTAVSTAAPAPGADAVMTTQAVEPEEATFIRASLAQLGLQHGAPVTLDMVRDERAWVAQLARELGGVLQGAGPGAGLMRARGVVGLDEVWGGWNRARGVALIPPATFLQVLPHLPEYTDPPVTKRTFAASGLSVLITPPYTRVAFASRLVGLVSLAGPRTTVEVAQDEELPIALVDEMVLEVESEGEVCRDESEAGVGLALQGGYGGEIRWWPNIFQGYEWDGQPG